ncbi:uncharacterized protein LOC124455341 [Xenia sp. Carnegie-2017]|uniref:uncharacterized protein LOC124455341 n=1 Tax=Xenia sp. Carnegie-2017 TaxID=2897299 RepID=UPI001F0496AC|nr:uncharacterized protein LOC124455341 [Xenia sp. Carnegie-2017]
MANELFISRGKALRAMEIPKEMRKCLQHRQIYMMFHRKCYVRTVLLKEILKPFLKAVSWLLEKWILGHLLGKKEWKIEKKIGKCCRCNENEAVLRCRQCGVLRYICQECDDVHKNNPLHDREVWLDGYFQYIKPTQSISSDGKICSIDRSCPILYPSSCQLCNESIIKTTNSSLVIMINVKVKMSLCNFFTESK